MSYLLDISVISETIKNQPDESVIDWLAQIPSEALYISSITLGEIRKGIEGLADKKRKEKLRIWLERDFTDWFEGRILSVDTAVADKWGQMRVEARHVMPVIEGLMAATALAHNLRLVTRNMQDFSYAGLEVINPWAE